MILLRKGLPITQVEALRIAKRNFAGRIRYGKFRGVIHETSL